MSHSASFTNTIKNSSLLLLLFGLFFNVHFANAQLIKDKSISYKGPAFILGQASSSFWNIKNKADRSRTLEFINDGTEPLVISAVESKSGFEIVRYPKEAILPGQKASIEIVCSIKKTGSFNGSIILRTNATNGSDAKKPGIIVLKIKGKVSSR